MKTPNKIAEYRRRGFKIRVNHCRDYSSAVEDVNFNRICAITKHDFFKSLRPNNNGGVTALEVRRPDGKEFYAESHCSWEDNYSRAAGISLCWTRLEDQGAFTE